MIAEALCAKPGSAKAASIDSASEAALSRMYGGIHYLFDNYDGIDSGFCVGSIHNSTLQFLADN